MNRLATKQRWSNGQDELDGNLAAPNNDGDACEKSYSTAVCSWLASKMLSRWRPNIKLKISRCLFVWSEPRSQSRPDKTNTCVWAHGTCQSSNIAALSDAAPATKLVSAKCEWASVSGTLASHARHFPSSQLTIISTVRASITRTHETQWLLSGRDASSDQGPVEYKPFSWANGGFVCQRSCGQTLQWLGLG